MSILLHLALLAGLAAAPYSLDRARPHDPTLWPVYDTVDHGGTVLSHQMKLIRQGKLHVDQPYGNVNGWEEYPDTALHNALARGSLNLVQELVEQWGAEINPEDSRRWSPLASAYAHGRLEIARYLIEHGADTSRKNKYYSMFEAACESADREIIHLALQNHAPPTAKEWNSAFSGICASGDIELVRTALSHGAGVRKQIDAACSPLTVACKAGHLEITRILIEHGAEIKQSEQEKHTHPYDDNAFNAAIQSGNLELVQYLAAQTASFPSTVEENTAYLHEAAYSGHAHIIRYLLTYDCHIRQKNNWGYTPLISACRSGCLDAVRLLVEHGASLSDTDKKNGTPLHMAAQTGNAALIDYLIQHGAEINPLNKTHETPLITACRSNNIATALRLLELGADHSIRDQNNKTAAQHIDYTRILVHALPPALQPRYLTDNTPSTSPALNLTDNELAARFHIACQNGHDTNILHGLAQGVDPNAPTLDGIPLLHHACRRAHLSTIRKMLAQGAHLQTQDHQGNTTLHAAAQGRPETLEYILQQQQNINTANKKGQTPLALACDSMENTAILLRHGAKVDTPDLDGNTPLLHACRNEYAIGIAAQLLQHGANVNHQNQQGETALRLAYRSGQEQLCIYLLQHGADPDASPDPENGTLLVEESYNENTGLLHQLLKSGADPSLTDDMGETPLHRAVFHKNTTSIMLLLHYGADTDTVSKHEYTPLLESTSCPEIAHILLAFGASPYITLQDNETLNILDDKEELSYLKDNLDSIRKYKPSFSLSATINRLRHQTRRHISRILRTIATQP